MLTFSLFRCRLTIIQGVVEACFHGSHIIASSNFTALWSCIYAAMEGHLLTILTLFWQMLTFNRHTTNDPTAVCQHTIDKFFFAFLWSFVYYMLLLAAVAMARHYRMLYQASAAIWHT
jgi:hypothetical protein